MSDVSKKARRDEAREHARDMREAERKRRSRNSLILKIVVGLVLVAVAAGTVWGITAFRQAAIDAATPKPGPANMLSDGIILQGDGTGQIVAARTPAIPPKGEPTPTNPDDYADGVVRIVMYVDYFCPVCQVFEATNALQLKKWVSAGAATLEIHPIAILDRASLGTRYASRSANAAACVAEFAPDSFFGATAALYAQQPAENTSGLTNEEIVTVLQSAEIDDPDVTACIDDERFSQWVTAATERTREAIPNSDLPGIAGTPTVIVNGVLYEGAVDDQAAFDAFVTAIATDTYVPAE